MILSRNLKAVFFVIFVWIEQEEMMIQTNKQMIARPVE